MYKSIEYGPIKFDQYCDFIPDSQGIVGRNRFGNIIKQTDSRGVLPEIQYAYENNMFVCIRGHIKGDGETFHLGSINNTPLFRRDMFNVAALLKIVEEDLRLHGISRIEADCTKRLLRIATERYGFRKSKESLSTNISRLAHAIILTLKRKEDKRVEIGVSIVKHLTGEL